ncbi:MAG: FkbM family methyltransferase [Gammaproteobacteria bacterium]|nr:FkbM family methyltransferase [Gammaproteobacteria bacterium]
MVDTAYGLKLSANYNDETFKFYVSGAYGTFYWDRIGKFAVPFVFLDIGANQGLYAIGAAKNPLCVASYAFEPVPHTFDFLKANIALNGVTDRCIPVMKAVGERHGVAEIALKEGHSGVATLAGSNLLKAVAQTRASVAMIDGRDLEKLIEPVDRPILVKIDVEGYESVVIDQLLKTSIAGRIAEAFLEINEDWVDVDGIKNRLRGAGLAHFMKVGAGRQYDLLATREPV